MGAAHDHDLEEATGHAKHDGMHHGGSGSDEEAAEKEKV